MLLVNFWPGNSPQHKTVRVNSLASQKSPFQATEKLSDYQNDFSQSKLNVEELPVTGELPVRVAMVNSTGSVTASAVHHEESQQLMRQLYNRN